MLFLSCRLSCQCRRIEHAGFNILLVLARIIYGSGNRCCEISPEYKHRYHTCVTHIYIISIFSANLVSFLGHRHARTQFVHDANSGGKNVLSCGIMEKKQCELYNICAHQESCRFNKRARRGVME